MPMSGALSLEKTMPRNVCGGSLGCAYPQGPVVTVHGVPKGSFQTEPRKTFLVSGLLNPLLCLQWSSQVVSILLESMKNLRQKEGHSMLAQHTICPPSTQL